MTKKDLNTLAQILEDPRVKTALPLGVLVSGAIALSNVQSYVVAAEAKRKADADTEHYAREAEEQ